MQLDGRDVKMYVAIFRLLTNLSRCYDLWRLTRALTLDELSDYAAHAASFGAIWTVLNFKVTTWVHWYVCHSSYLLTRYRNLFCFSSVPCEHKHKGFKADFANCFKGWKLTKPIYSVRSLTHIVHLSAVDLGLAKHLHQ